jgi:Putative Ig domain
LESSQPGQRARIYGTPQGPAKPALVTYRITVTDEAHDTGHVDLVINRKLAISTSHALPAANEGKSYASTLVAAGGARPYRWTAPDAPTGLSIDPDTGAIAWESPTGTQFAIRVADNDGHTDERTFAITVRPVHWWERWFHTGNWLTALGLGLPVTGAVWILFYAIATPGRTLTYLGVGLLTALAAFLSGCLIGFLFGIPRAVSSGKSRLDPASNEYAPSSNLAEVSDWLTKLLLGAGLVQLTHLGAPIAHLIDTVAAGLTATAATTVPSSAAKVMAGSILIGYVAIGLLDSYVVTTLWYQNRLGKVG